MHILIVDDVADNRLLLSLILEKAGYSNLTAVPSAREAFLVLHLDDEKKKSDIDLILLDIMMPEMDGIAALKKIKEYPHLNDLPVIMVTALTELDYLEKAFAEGAVDYITKPIKKIELLARIGSVLKLKEEMDKRKEREEELIKITHLLEKANQKLTKLVSLDGLTGIANRRYFDESFSKEWKIARRNQSPLSILLLDIDYFKNFNDTYGHQAGDDCLKKLAQCMEQVVKRPSDLVARYGGEEFVVLLPDTDSKGAFTMAELLREEIEGLKIPHEDSSIAPYVTVSIGLSTVIPLQDMKKRKLLEAADEALYRAKQEGRNRVSTSFMVQKRGKRDGRE